MTVREVVAALKTAKTISLGWGCNAIEFDKDNALMMEAYGDFAVDCIQSMGDEKEQYYEVNIAMLPVRAGC